MNQNCSLARAQGIPTGLLRPTASQTAAGALSSHWARLGAPSGPRTPQARASGVPKARPRPPARVAPRRAQILSQILAGIFTGIFKRFFSVTHYPRKKLLSIFGRQLAVHLGACFGAGLRKNCDRPFKKMWHFWGRILWQIWGPRSARI